MGKITDILAAQNETIKNLRMNGESYNHIANILGCSSTTVRKYCISNGIKGNVKNKIIGKKFSQSNLLVLEVDPNPPFKSHETGYRCKCLICGDVQTFRKSNIVNGPGCHKCSDTLGGRGYQEWEIGQKFGYIEILDKGSRNGYILGKCQCGTVREFALKHLKGQGGHSRTISCGCAQKSSGEIKIESLLRENNINFKTQYRIDDFSIYSPFDFAIFNDDGELIKLIEYDGEQHFEPIKLFGGEENFLIQQERDIKKNEYCKKNNIPLLRIPYWDYNKIDIGYLI